MPRERLAWVPSRALDALTNGRLVRLWDAAEASLRYGVQWISASTTLVLSSTQTLVEVDTSAGNVTITLPSAPQHVGYAVQLAKAASANTLSLDGTNVANGAVNLTLQHDVLTLVSNGSQWRIV